MKKQNRKTMVHFWGKVMIGLLLLGLVAGCNPNDNNKKSDRKYWMIGGLFSLMDKPQGKAQISMSISNSQSNVSRVTVTISGTGITTPIISELVKVGQNWQTIVNDIPTGSDRLFIGKAYDAGGLLRFQGQATNVLISFNQITNIFILLQDLFPVDPFSNAVPVIDAFAASTNLVAQLGSVNFSVTAHDPNPADTLTYLWSATGGFFNNSTTTDTIWSAPNIAGLYTITVTVTDSKGSSCKKSYIVNVQADTGSGMITISFNEWPVVENITSTECCLASGESANLALIATDGDGDLLSYFWSSSCGTFDNAAAQNPMFTATSTIAGDCAVTVNIDDNRGGVNSGSLTIRVKAPVAPLCTDISTLEVGATMNGVCSSSAFTSGANSIVNGSVTTVAAYTSGVNALVTGDVTSGSAYTSGATSIVNGNVWATGDVTLGAGSIIIGYVHSGSGVIIYGVGATVGSVQ